jgi:transposase
MRSVQLSYQYGETSASLLRGSLVAEHPRLRERLTALTLIAAGLSAKAVAHRLGRHRGTVESWVQRFNTCGLDGLRPTFRGQPGTVLSPEELTQLQQTIAHPPRQAGLKTGLWTGKVVRAFVKRHFGKTISAATARRYLHRLGFRRKRPRKHFVKANPEAQQAFAQALQHREQHREAGSVTVYMDQGQIWQDALPRLGWFPRGQPAWVESTSPGRHAKVLFYVAIVRPVGRVITMLCTWFTQEATAKFFAKLRRGLKDQPIDLVYDNAPHHKGAVIEKALVRYHVHAHRLPIVHR